MRNIQEVRESDSPCISARNWESQSSLQCRTQSRNLPPAAHPSDSSQTSLYPPPSTGSICLPQSSGLLNNLTSSRTNAEYYLILNIMKAASSNLLNQLHADKRSTLSSGNLSEILNQKRREKENLDRSHASTKDSKQDGSLAEQERVVMSRKELVEFTKKFAISKIDYQQEIEQLKAQVENKSQRIQVLEEMVSELKNDEKCMEQIIEKLQNRHCKQLEMVNQKMKESVMEKQNQIAYLQEDARKLRLWLEDERNEVKRCMEFLKIKDEIVTNLEWELSRYKAQSFYHSKSTERVSNFNSTMRNGDLFLPSFSSNHGEQPCLSKSKKGKKIIVRKRNESSTPQKKQVRQKTQKQESPTLEQRIQELEAVVEERNLQVARLQSEVNQLKGKGMRSMNEESASISRKIQETTSQREKMLLEKCMYLEKHIEKLMRESKHSEMRYNEVLRKETTFMERWVEVESVLEDTHLEL